MIKKDPKEWTTESKDNQTSFVGGTTSPESEGGCGAVDNELEWKANLIGQW